MKHSLASSIGLILLTLATSTAVAGFDVVQDGRTYRCEETGGGSGGTGGAACAEKAYRGPFTREESIQLCAGASSTGPADCATEAYRGPFTREESLKLCRNGGTIERANCAAQAYRGPYTREEAIRLCSSGDSRLLIRSLKLMESSAEIRQRVLEIKGQQALMPRTTIEGI